MQPIDRRRNNPQLMQVPNQHSDSAECGISLRHHCHNLLSSDVRFYSSNYLSNIWSLDRAIGLDGHRGDYNLPPQGPGEIHVSDSEIPQQNLNANTSPHQLNANPLIENTIPSYFESWEFVDYGVTSNMRLVDYPMSDMRLVDYTTISGIELIWGPKKKKSYPRIWIAFWKMNANWICMRHDSSDSKSGEWIFECQWVRLYTCRAELLISDIIS